MRRSCAREAQALRTTRSGRLGNEEKVLQAYTVNNCAGRVFLSGARPSSRALPPACAFATALCCELTNNNPLGST